MKIGIILPTFLFKTIDIFNDFGHKDIIILYEHPANFTKFKYHKMKLVMHRATMKYYHDYLSKKLKSLIVYLNYYDDYIKVINKYKYESVYAYYPYDNEISNELKQFKNIKFYVNNGFICDNEIYKLYLDNSDTNKYINHSFYIWCRRHFNILMNGKKPLGGKWSFDDENRLPFPKDQQDAYLFNIKKNKYIDEAKIYINDQFKKNHGSNNYYLSISHNDAEEHLKKFIHYKLNNFGPFEDAVNKNVIFGYHSVLSPIINIGLLTPQYILTEIESYYKKNKNKIKIQSVEGFIRQLFWREYCAFVYITKEHEFYKNTFNHNKKIKSDWYNGNTVFPFINDIINKCLQYGYAHHIERLMYVGNVMLLTNVHPKYVFKWFMEMFIDSYSWVMVPNVYGMSQYAGGSIMTKRPYFCSSNYINKMSSYKKKPNIYEKITIGNDSYEWYELLDSLFYYFIDNNKNILKKNYSIAGIISLWNKKTKSEKYEITAVAKKYIKSY